MGKNYKRQYQISDDNKIDSNNRDNNGRFLPKNTIGCLGGRSKQSFPTPKHMSDKLEEYLDHCQENDKPISETGFMVYAGVTNLDSYKKDKDNSGFKEILKVLHQLSEQYLADNGLKNKVNVTMAIFLLKARHGYQDKITIAGDPTAPIVLQAAIPSKRKIIEADSTTISDDTDTND